MQNQIKQKPEKTFFNHINHIRQQVSKLDITISVLQRINLFQEIYAEQINMFEKLLRYCFMKFYIKNIDGNYAFI